MTSIQQEYGKKGCLYNSKTGSRIAGQMPMHKKGLVRVHIPGANGPRSPRMKCWRNWLVRRKWQRQVLHTKCPLSGKSQLLGMMTRSQGSNCQGEFRSWIWGLGYLGCHVLGSSLLSPVCCLAWWSLSPVQPKLSALHLDPAVGTGSGAIGVYKWNGVEYSCQCHGCSLSWNYPEKSPSPQHSHFLLAIMER